MSAEPVLLKKHGLLAGCILTAGAVFILSLSMGASGAGPVDMLRAMASDAPSPDEEIIRNIFLNIRLPRTLVAGLAGAALAMAGVLSQGLFRNSLASPSVMGVEAGAALAAAAVFYLGHAFISWYVLPLAAFGGALTVTMLLFAFMRNSAWPGVHALLLAGLALNTLLGALTTLLVSFSLEDYQKSTALMHWLLGGLTGKGFEHALTGCFILAAVVALIYRRMPQLDVIALGEDIATTLSVNVDHLRRWVTIAIAALTGTAVAVAGAIPFVGLVVPHITRSLAGPAHKRLLLLSALNGCTLTLLADLVARTVMAPRELEVGLVTSLIGAPFFILILARGGNVTGRSHL